jgi:hypothetical protein
MRNRSQLSAKKPLTAEFAEKNLRERREGPRSKALLNVLRGSFSANSAVKRFFRGMQSVFKVRADG